MLPVQNPMTSVNSTELTIDLCLTSEIPAGALVRLVGLSSQVLNIKTRTSFADAKDLGVRRVTRGAPSGLGKLSDPKNKMGRSPAKLPDEGVWLGVSELSTCRTNQQHQLLCREDAVRRLGKNSFHVLYCELTPSLVA